jgi:DNA-binding MarR family transcriptional regulator
VERLIEARADAPVRLGELSGSLGFLLRIGQLRIYEQFYARFGDQGLRPGEFSVLWVVHLNPGISQGKVAQALRIKPAHMTKIVRRFEASGTIRREIPDHDRRSVHLWLTDAGDAFVGAHKPAFIGPDSYHSHDLAPGELADLIRLLRRYAGLDGGAGP